MLAAFLSKVEFFRCKYLVARERRIGGIRDLNRIFWIDHGEIELKNADLFSIAVFDHGFRGLHG